MGLGKRTLGSVILGLISMAALVGGVSAQDLGFTRVSLICVGAGPMTATAVGTIGDIPVGLSCDHTLRAADSRFPVGAGSLWEITIVETCKEGTQVFHESGMTRGHTLQLVADDETVAFDPH
jgi:hypothetical protein